PDNNYYNYLSTPLVCEDRTQIVKGMILKEMEQANRGGRDPIYIAWDEYNVWYRARTSADMMGNRALEEHYNLEDALVIAGFLNVFVRNADVVKIANMAQLVNVIAPIFTSEDEMFRQTIYFPLQLFSEHMHGTSLDLHVDCETYDTERFFIGLAESITQQEDVPYLDASATYNDGEVVLCVVNRHRDRPVTTEIISQEGSFTGNFRVYEVNGPDIKTMNDFGSEPVKTVKKEDIRARGEKITYTFPPHSFTLLKGTIE
ncbi:MAG TPA: alpha-N-arabinofuranosidase, partial [Bacteroides sp.]|nr:alpha-N-arabinofuranosidase [Bacteroides sp.]